MVTHCSTTCDRITNGSQGMRRRPRLPRAARSFLGGADHDVNRRCAFTLPLGRYISCAGCDPTEFQVRREVSMVTILMMTFILISSPSDAIPSTLTDDHETYGKDALGPVHLWSSQKIHRATIARSDESILASSGVLVLENPPHSPVRTSPYHRFGDAGRPWIIQSWQCCPISFTTLEIGAQAMATKIMNGSSGEVAFFFVLFRARPIMYRALEPCPTFDRRPCGLWNSST